MPEIPATPMVAAMQKHRKNDPPENESPKAVALRMAAIEFADGRREPLADDFDSRGAKRNRKLLRAAVAYAQHVAPQKGNDDGR